MKFDVISVKSPGKAKKEDAYAIQENQKIMAVFDGVSPLPTAPPADIHGDTGARKASRLFKSHFESTAITNNLAAELIAANEKLRQLMISEGMDLSEKHHLHSTCAAVVSIGEQTLHYAQLGDCMILSMDAHGQVKLLTRNQVAGVNLRAEEKRKRDREEGLSVAEESFFKDPIEAAAYRRNMANTPEGYGVANGMPEMADYIEDGEVPLADLQAVLLITDGLFHPDLELEEVLRLVLKQGLAVYAQELDQLEESRGLHRDDRTGILIQFS